MSRNSMIAKVIAVVVMVFGVVFLGVGGVAYGMVGSTLAEQHITVADDAACMAGAVVDNPFAAYCEQEIINEHALHSTEGKTYAQMDREDPARPTAMNASFLRASLFTSVLAFGVSALVMGLGVLFLLVGGALLTLAGRKPVEAPADEAV